MTYRATSNPYIDNDTFFENSYFSHQEEFRFLIDKDVDDYFDMNIGNIEYISALLPTKKKKETLHIEADVLTVEKI